MAPLGSASVLLPRSLQYGAQFSLVGIATIGKNRLLVQECVLLGDAWGYAMQGMLFLFCLTSLYIKWSWEHPQRLFWVFGMDVSKQCLAAGVYHVLNMGMAMVLSDDASGNADECAWYWTSFMIDCIFGTMLNFLILRASETLFGYKSGDYGVDGYNFEEGGAAPTVEDEHGTAQIDFGMWFRQVLGFCVVIILSKLITFTFLVGNPWVSDVGVSATTWIADPDKRLFFVMVVTPTIMNTLVFWITDEFLKDSSVDDDGKVVGMAIIRRDSSKDRVSSKDTQDSRPSLKGYGTVDA